MIRRAAIILLVSCTACSDGVEQQPVDPVVPEPACAPSELETPSGACITPGLIDGDCADGFVHDGERGCNAVLPDPCPPGQMAVPGQDACREVAPCGTAPWGDMPLEANTQHVDQSYPGNDSNGSEAQPWLTLADALAAVAPGGSIAMAAGSYGGVTIASKPVRLWGRCPELVELIATPSSLAGVVVRAGASGSELRGFAVRGDGWGVVVSGSQDVVVDQLSIHDLPNHGLEALDQLGPASVRLSRSLIEAVVGNGLVAYGSPVAIEQSVIRGVTIEPGTTIGVSLTSQISADTDLPSSVAVTSSVLERAAGQEILAFGSSLSFDASVVRDGDANSLRAVSAETYPGNPARPQLTMAGSIVERAHGVGVLLLGADATLTDTTIRDIAPSAQGRGHAISAQLDPLFGARSNLSLERADVRRTHEVAIQVQGSDLTAHRVAIADVNLGAMGRLSRGLNMTVDPGSGARATAVVSDSLVERAMEIGITVDSSDLSLERVIVRDIATNAEGLLGRGVNIQPNADTFEPPSAVISDTRVERTHEFAIVSLGGSLTVTGSEAVGTAANGAGEFGDGITVASDFTPATATVSGTSIADNVRAGLANFGASVELGTTSISCHTFDLEGETFRGLSFAFKDLGNNRCGCPAEEQCAAVTNALKPPAAR